MSGFRYNAQSTFHRGDEEKHPGMAEMGLMRDGLTVEIIPDGHHLTPRAAAICLCENGEPPDSADRIGSGSSLAVVCRWMSKSLEEL